MTPQPLTPQQKPALLAQIVATDRAQLGVEEQPRFSNWGNVVKQYLAAVGLTDPEPWCMALIVWAVKRACARAGVPFGATTLIATGSCQAQADHARGLGVLIAAGDVAAGRARVLPGYVMVEWEDALGRYAHSGVVTVAPDAQGSFTSCEGNTNDTGGREGYAVLEHRRNIHETAGAHPKYAFIAVC